MNLLGRDCVNYYCFNDECSISIFRGQNRAVMIPYSPQMFDAIRCKNCNEQLVSASITKINRQVAELTEFNPIDDSAVKYSAFLNVASIRITLIESGMAELLKKAKTLKKMHIDYQRICANLEETKLDRQMLFDANGW